MQLCRLELRDVRSYRRVEVEFPAGASVLVGPNAQGKTNLLEAVHRVATGSSHRVAGDRPLVRMGAEVGVIRCELQTDAGRRRRIELELAAGRRTRTRVDGQDVRRSADAIGVLRAVLFAPEDLAIVRGDPGERRRYLDDLLGQRRPAFAALRADYERTLRQRNQLLKRARHLGGSAAEAAAATLEAWTEQLVTLGAQLLAARLAAVRTLTSPVDGFYRELADRPEPVQLVYRSAAIEDLEEIAPSERSGVPAVAPLVAALHRAYAEVADDERARGMTLVGPHRDDLELSIGGLPAKGYASHGEAWSLALSLKLATFTVLAEVGDRPVVLLDDVFAELDTTRRDRLARSCGRFDQVLVTAAVEEDVPLAGHRIDVTIAEAVSSLVPRGRVGER